MCSPRIRWLHPHLRRSFGPFGQGAPTSCAVSVSRRNCHADRSRERGCEPRSSSSFKLWFFVPAASIAPTHDCGRCANCRGAHRAQTDVLLFFCFVPPAGAPATDIDRRSAGSEILTDIAGSRLDPPQFPDQMGDGDNRRGDSSRLRSGGVATASALGLRWRWLASRPPDEDRLVGREASPDAIEFGAGIYLVVRGRSRRAPSARQAASARAARKPTLAAIADSATPHARSTRATVIVQLRSVAQLVRS